MLETLIALLTVATPYILLVVGAIGAFMLLARATGKTVANAIRS